MKLSSPSLQFLFVSSMSSSRGVYRCRSPWRRTFSDQTNSRSGGDDFVNGDSHLKTLRDPNYGFRQGPRGGYKFSGGFQNRSFRQRPPFWTPPSKPADYRNWEYAVKQPPSSCETFVVLSYNILADYLARDHRSQLYWHIPPNILDWEWRKRKILFELGLWSPDIMCLQEVDRFQDLEEDLKLRGYNGVWKMRTGHALDGCAIFWRNTRFQLKHEEHIEFNQHGLRDNVAQICVLESRNVESAEHKHEASFSSYHHPTAANQVVVCNIHVLYNPNRGDIKLGQVRVLLDKAQVVSQTWNDAPIVICGDFNCTPKSPLYNFISEQKLNLSGLAKNQISGQQFARIYASRSYTEYRSQHPAQGMVGFTTSPNYMTNEYIRGIRNRGHQQNHENGSFSGYVQKPTQLGDTLNDCFDENCMGHFRTSDLYENDGKVNNETIYIGLQNSKGQDLSLQSSSSDENFVTQSSKAFNNNNDSKEENEEHSFVVTHSNKEVIKNTMENVDFGPESSIIRVDTCYSKRIYQEKFAHVDSYVTSEKLINTSPHFGIEVTSGYVSDHPKIPDHSCKEDASLDEDQRISNESENEDTHCFNVDQRFHAVHVDGLTKCHEDYNIGETMKMDDKLSNGLALNLSCKSQIQSSCLPSQLQSSSPFAEGDVESNKNVCEKIDGIEKGDGREIQMPERPFIQPTCIVKDNNIPYQLQLDKSRPENLKDSTFCTNSEDPEIERNGFCPCLWIPSEIETATGNASCNIIEHCLNLKSSYAEVEDYGGTKDVDGEPHVTSYNRRFMGTVDYIWFSEGLQTVKVLDTIPKHVLLRTPGFPTQKWGSDHIALACQLAFTGNAQTSTR